MKKRMTTSAPSARRAIGLFTVAMVVLGGGMVRAGGSRLIEITNFAAEDDLELNGVAVTANGGLVAGPRQEIRSGPAVPVLWNVVPLPDGGAFAVGGTPGIVLYLPPAGEGRRVAALGEVDVTAATSGRDPAHLFAAITPGGRIVNIDTAGEMSEVTSVASRYVWAMATAPDGTVWIAGGHPGGLYRLPPGSASVETVVDMGTQQIRCLLMLDDGSVLFGTSGAEQIRRLAPDGAMTVLHDAALDEVVSLAAGDDGTIYAAVAAATPGAAPKAKPTAPGGAAKRVVPGSQAGRSNGSSSRVTRVRGQVLALEPDGRVRRLWESKDLLAVSVLSRPDGSVWVGTSPGANIVQVLPDGRSGRVAHLPARSVTALRPGRDGVVWASTGGLGLLAVLDPSAAAEGIVNGAVQESGPGSRYGIARWRARSSSPKGIVFSLRSGNTERPDASWSAWGRWTGGGEVAAPAVAPGRFVQWRARFNRPGVELASVQIAYLPANRVPLLTAAEVLPAGVVLERLPTPPGQVGISPAGARNGSPSAESAAKNTKRTLPMRRVFRPGRRTVTWDATDADGDVLTARLWVRRDGEADAALFADRVEAPFLVFDESALPDGGYVFRVEVSDQRDNTPDRAGSATRETARFVIDRTAPTIDGPTLARRQDRDALEFEVEDAGMAPQSVKMRIDQVPPVGVLPVDGVADSPRETYRVRLPALAAGEHVVVVTATDASGNTSAARRRFVVPPATHH
ncbi:MAG: hypothetical protein ACE5IK_08180 [Acidobacteriota bacterium]